jgi:transcriptional regulator with XRE-family HTH domain
MSTWGACLPIHHHIPGHHLPAITFQAEFACGERRFPRPAGFAYGYPMSEIARIFPQNRETPDGGTPDQGPADRGAPEPLWREVLGSRLRSLRAERDETLAQTAERAGISPQYLSEIERGRKEPSSEMIAALAGALGITVADLMSAAAEDLRAAETFLVVTTLTTSRTGTSVGLAQPLAPPRRPAVPGRARQCGLTGHGLTKHGLTGHGLTGHGLTKRDRTASAVTVKRLSSAR